MRSRVASGAASVHPLRHRRRGDSHRRHRLLDDEAAATPRLTSRHTAIGTPLYMAPEQMRNAEVDGRADVYSLAMMVYEMLTGVVPDDDGHDFMTLAMLRMRNDPPPMRAHDPSIPAALDEIVLAALSREPEERPAAARFGELLTQAVFPPEGKLPRVILSRTDGEGPSLVSSGEGPSLRSG